ncbi:hypothetical protein ACWC98_26630 [Streptomyces goshikiensis]
MEKPRSRCPRSARPLHLGNERPGEQALRRQLAVPVDVVEHQPVAGGGAVAPLQDLLPGELLEERVGETLMVMHMTILVEQCWREISSGLAEHAVPVQHFVLHADQDTLRARIAGDTVLGPDSPFRLRYLEPCAEAARAWLHAEADVVDTTHLTPAQAAEQIAEAVKR